MNIPLNEAYSEAVPDFNGIFPTLSLCPSLYSLSQSFYIICTYVHADAYALNQKHSCHFQTTK